MSPFTTGTADRSPPPWQGIHHLALVTRDLDATVRFYAGILAMPVVATGRAPGDGPRHLMIGLGGGATLHFWETPEATIFAPPTARNSFAPGALQHLSLRLPDEAALVALRDRLRAAGTEVTDLFDQGPVRLCFFRDNNGLLLEATRWRDDDPTSRPPAYDDERFFADPDPLPAIFALAHGHDLAPPMPNPAPEP